MNNKTPEVDYKNVLADSGMPTTKEGISSAFNEIVKDNGLITNTSSMSPFWRLIHAIVTQPVLWLWDTLANTVLANLFVATATGRFLDMHANSVNISRKEATFTKGVATFYKNDKNIAITVKAGTLIQTERINGVVYSLVVDSDTLIDNGVEQQDINVTAKISGKDSNLAPGYYRILPTAVSGIANVRNNENYLTSPGADIESDAELRGRIRNQFNLVGNYHIDAVYRGMIASISGISIDRIFFLHEAPRGPGTANAYLLLDTGVASQPFIDKVNDYLNQQGHHGHGDGMECFAMPETKHELTVTVYVDMLGNLADSDKAQLKKDVDNMVRCAFRDNSDYEVVKTWPYQRFSFSKLGEEIHRQFPIIKSLHFSLDDIVSELAVPRLTALKVEVTNA